MPGGIYRCFSFHFLIQRRAILCLKPGNHIRFLLIAAVRIFCTTKRDGRWFICEEQNHRKIPKENDIYPCNPSARAVVPDACQRGVFGRHFVEIQGACLSFCK